MGCGACCIAPSIQQAIPNMPNGKAAGEYCANLDANTLLCRLWGTDAYPELCTKFMPEESICGNSREQALETIRFLESDTKP